MGLMYKKVIVALCALELWNKVVDIICVHIRLKS